MKGIFVTGTGTGVGKTFVSSALAIASSGAYWKPIQSGTDGGGDEKWVLQNTRNLVEVHKPYLSLKEPISPNRAALNEGKVFKICDIIKPKISKEYLIVEGAGGVMVPLNDHEIMLDLMKQFNFPVVLVSLNYLGSINHTLLSIQALRSRDIDIRGIIFNGDPLYAGYEEDICRFAGVPLIASIPWSLKFDSDFMIAQSEKLRPFLSTL